MPVAVLLYQTRAGLTLPNAALSLARSCDDVMWASRERPSEMRKPGFSAAQDLSPNDCGPNCESGTRALMLSPSWLDGQIRSRCRLLSRSEHPILEGSGTPC